MAVLLDTTAIAPEDRFELYRDAMMGVTGCTRVDLEQPDGGVSSRMNLWSFGATNIFSNASTGVAMIRDKKAAGGSSPEAVAIAVHGLGTGRHDTGAGQRLIRSGDLMVVDITRPYDFSWYGFGSSTSLQVPIADLGMSLDAVQRAANRLRSSPLYDLVSRHLVDLTREADRLDDSPMALALGDSNTQLTRALLTGAAYDEGTRRRDATEETLLAQVDAYVRQNLRDPALSAAAVANALAVSRRHLFRMCTQADLSLEQYIIGKRLEGAKAELGSIAGRSRTIARVASSWGFKDPTHFARRFKAAYGILPKDWRRLAVEEALRNEPAPVFTDPVDA
jgi:AraC-like DNA-binding protein